ncbi:MAG: hypothetical protein RDO_1660 [Flavobacteriales endosymbiont of Rhyzopertha dominica]|nr:MAG: ribonuclease P protein component [Candidatus Shikimatogenerans bostrichidophilus]
MLLKKKKLNNKEIKTLFKIGNKIFINIINIIYKKKDKNKFIVIIPKKNINKSYKRNKIKRLIYNIYKNFIKFKYKNNKNYYIIIIYKINIILKFKILKKYIISNLKKIYDK